MMEQSPALGFWDKSSEDHLRNQFPVHRACRDGDTGSLSVLLAHGEYDLYTEDQFYGWTPAHWSAYYGKLECLQVLVTAGVNFDVATQRFHQTPAHVAAFGNQPHCLMWLIQSGAGVNAQDYLGETPAHKAARSGGLECLGILKASGAIFSIPNNNGHMPKDLALSCSNEPCAEYIQQVDGSLHVPNGLASNHHLCRKRGTDDLVNGDLKKARKENGSDPLPGEPFGGTENMEMTNSVAEENGLVGQQSAVHVTPVKGEVGGQGAGQARGQTGSPTSNGLSLPPSVGCPAPLPNCSNGIQDAPTPCMHPPHPQGIGPARLQDREVVSLYTEADLDQIHPKHTEAPMQTDPHQGVSMANGMDVSDHENGVAKERVALSASALEHHATVEQALGYNKLCESAYCSTSYCHFF